MGVKATAYRLKANKTKLYAFAKQYYPNIEPMKKTEFIKYGRSRDYALDFWDGEHYHHIFLSVLAGKARLGDEWTDYDDNDEPVNHWHCHTIGLDELQKFGFVEEMPKSNPNLSNRGTR